MPFVTQRPAEAARADIQQWLLNTKLSQAGSSHSTAAAAYAWPLQPQLLCSAGTQRKAGRSLEKLPRLPAPQLILLFGEINITPDTSIQ